MGYCVFVKTLTGRNFMIYLNSTDITVGELKTKIREKEGIPEHQQKLLFAGKQMEDTRQLSEYQVQHESTIHLVLRLRGGGLPPETHSDDELSEREVKL